jgi:hypothetical protein
LGTVLLQVRSWSRATRIALVVAVSILGGALLFFLPRVPLGSHYHDFADKRTLWGIPNAWDVLSNIPFCIVGVWGVLWSMQGSSKTAFSDDRERIPYVIFFAGVALTGIGSFWYHMAPSNFRLPWDLLPMTCSFMSMVVAIVMERISIKAGLSLLAPLLLLGIASVAYWYFTEVAGRGDYRFYLFVQFFPPVVLAIIVVLFPPHYTGMKYLVIAFLLFVAAKIFEILDWKVYSATRVVSGHALKHVIAAVACLWIVRMLQFRIESYPVPRRIRRTFPPA